MPRKPNRSLTPHIENQDPSIGEQLERISGEGLEGSESPMTAEERLRLALGVINREDLSPEEKLRMEKAILSGTGPSSSGPSDDPSRSTNGSATSPPDPSPPQVEESQIWRPDPPQMLVAEADDSAFVRECCRRFLQILSPQMETLSEMQETLGATGMERTQSLALQQQLVLYEAARTVAIQVHLMHEEEAQSLLVPETGLISQDGRKLRKKPRTDA